MKLKAILLSAVLLCLTVGACAASDTLFELPKSTRSIEKEAFCGVPGLRRVVLPEGVREIGARAFADSGLGEIILPDSLAFIDDTAFEGCGPVRVTANRGSAAYEWAQRLGYIPKATASTEIELSVREQYVLNLDTLLFGAKLTYTSSNLGVASVDSQGVVTATGRGHAVISCHSSNIFLISFLVHVSDAPDQVRLEPAALHLGQGEAVQLEPVLPPFSHTRYTWTSANEAIATVSEAGIVQGRTKGGTSVTVRTHNGRTATVNVQVLRAPEEIALDCMAAALRVQECLRLTALLPEGTASRISWSSSDPMVAAVDDVGTVWGIGTGTATITARTFNGKSAHCAVTVSFPEVPEDDSVTYRALLIGQERFTMEICQRNRADVVLMENMLRTVKGLYGGAFSIEKRFDLTASGLVDAIRYALAGADQNDVSLFFIATHGDSTSIGEAAGRLEMSPEGYLSMGALANALACVPGRIIVILGSCGSGSAIYDESAKSRLEATANAAIEAFSNADTPAEADADDTAEVQPNTAELRVPDKFYVLTASAYQEKSYGWEQSDGESYNYFTRWLTEGVGATGRMPADSNEDGLLTLKELYDYITSVGDHYNMGFNHFQHVQSYPENSAFVLFRR